MKISRSILGMNVSEQDVPPRTSDEQPNEIRIWSSLVNAENVSDFLTANPSNVLDKVDERYRETRAWSSFQDGTTENVLSDGPTKERILLLPQSQTDQRKTSAKSDPRGVENIIAYIDRHRPPRKKKYRLSWRTFVGTMSGMDQVYAQSDFLEEFECLRSVVIFADSVFRGIGQVMFANSPLSGVIMTIGLFIGNWELALYGLLGTSVSTLTAHVLNFSYNSIRAGLYGYSGCLTAMGIAYFSFPGSPQMIAPVVIMSMFSTIFVVAVGKVLVQHLNLSPFTFSFQMCTWIWLLGALKFRYFFVDGTILSPGLLSTPVNKPVLSNVSFPGYSVQDNFVGFFASVAQVFFIENPYTGAIILVGIAFCSRILSFFALFGAVTGQLTAAYLLGLSRTAIHSGLWGFNSVLTCQALGGMFFVLHGYRIWLFTLYGSMMTVILQAAVSAFLSPMGMPTFTFPFTVICWIFCLVAGSTDLVAVNLTAVSIPEDHCRRFRLSKLVRTQFKFMSHLTSLSLTDNEDITWEELAKIKAEFVPILMCSYADRNDLSSLKLIVKEEVNIHSADHNARSPLHISAVKGNMAICRWLVEDLKVNVNLIDKFGGSPLFDAFWNGHVDLLPYLYSHGARLPAQKGKELAFYLNAFVYEGNVEAMQCLLSCGFNPNAGDYDGRNSLHMAVITNRLELVRYLVEETPIWLDINDFYRQTALDYARLLPDDSIANYLTDKLNNKHTPLLSLGKKGRKSQTSRRKYLHAKKNVREKSKAEPLPVSMEDGLVHALFCMSAAQEDVDKMDSFLTQFPHFNMMECVDYDSRSAAHVAAAEGRLRSIQFLARRCSRAHFRRMMNREDRWGVSPLDEACRHQHFEIYQFMKTQMLIDNDESDTEEQPSSQPDAQQGNIVTALRKWNKIFLFCTLAAVGAAERIDELFARRYFTPTELYADYHGRTPLHFAAANGHLSFVRVLVRHGYDVTNHVDRWGNTPIDEARRNKFTTMADELQLALSRRS